MGHIVDNAVDGGSLCFLSVRFKTVTRCVTFLENHTCCHRGKPRCRKNMKTDAILENHTCCLPELILQRQGSCCLWIILMHLPSMLGQFFVFSRLLQANRKLRYLLPHKKRKNFHICFIATEGSPGTYSVAVKHFKRERRFRLLGHIPHTLVDDGALFP